MSKNQIEAHKITKPIQLLAAWLVGLAIINISFLGAATKITTPDWIPALLSIASIVNVPLFVLSIFLLQTKFRPEMQEDSYYSEYINQKTNKSVKIQPTNNNVQELLLKIERLEAKLATTINPTNSSDDFQFKDLLFGINQHLNDRDAIKKELSHYGAFKSTSFGPDDSVPNKRVMSISQYLSTEKTNQLVSLAIKLKMDGYRLFDNQMEQTEEDVLIGSYGDIQFEF